MNDKTRTDVMKTACELTDRRFEKDKIISAIKKLYPEVIPFQLEFVAGAAIDMLESFDAAVNEAGGSPWKFEELSGMTFLDLLSRLATNHIRFHFEMPKE